MNETTVFVADVTVTTLSNINDNITESRNLSHETHSTEEEHENSNYILIIFGGVVIGALARQVLGSARIPIPHTAILQALGVLAAWAGTHWPVLMHVVDLRELHPGPLVHVFLPLLLFQPAFKAHLHVLRVTFNQIVVLSFGAFLITAGVTAVLVLWVLQYDWPLRVMCVFATVLAITDPSVQDFIAKCTGTSDETNGMLLGESLVSPIAAILVNKFFSFAVPEDVFTGTVLVGDLGYMLLAPLLAVVVAKVTAAWLQTIFNEAIMEITIVVVVVHLSSLLCDLAGVPGFLVTIALGLLLNANKTSVSPEVQTILYRFLLILKELIDSFTFLSVGILTYFRVTEAEDSLIVVEYSFALFAALCVFRTIALVVLSPLLRRFGHFKSLRHLFIVTCGGARGALILTMGLDIATPHNYPPHQRHIAHTIFIHVSIIVFLSQVINCVALGSFLGFFSDDAQSVRRKLERRNFLRNLEKLRMSSISALKLDKFIADADWELVEKSTQFEELNDEAEKRRFCCLKEASQQQACEGLTPPGLQDGSGSSESSASFERQRTKQRNSAIRKLLQAEKMAYWQMFSQGLLSKSAVQRLLGWADAELNEEGRYIDEKVESKFAKVANHLRKLRDEIAKKIDELKSPGSVEEAEGTRSKFIRKLTSAVAYVFHACDAGLTTTALVVEFVPAMGAVRKGLFIYNACYVGIFTMVVMGEIFVFRRKFFNDLWHVAGLICMCFGLFDALILSTVDNIQQSEHAHSRSSLTGTEMEFLRVFVIFTRYFRLYKVVEITPALLGLLLRLLDNRMGRRLIWGYDLARGYVMGEREVVRQLAELAEGDMALVADIRRHCTQSRLRVIRSMGLLQMRHPGVAARVKTRYAACIVLNGQRDVIKQFGEEGLLEDTDMGLLLKEVELKLKKLANSAPRVAEVRLSDIVSNLPWVCGDAGLHDFIIQHGEVMTLDANQVLVEEGHPPGYIYIIISGIVKVECDSDFLQDVGECPEDEAMDYMTTGNVIGEYSLVTRTLAANTVRAFTQLKVLYLGPETMREAMGLTSEADVNARDKRDESRELPSLEYRLWRAVATRISLKVLTDEPAFMRVHKHRLRMRLADAYLVDGEQTTDVTLDSTMSDVILVNGRAMDNMTREVYSAPCYMPYNVISLTLLKDDNSRPVLFIVPAEGDCQPRSHVSRPPVSVPGSPVAAFRNGHRKRVHEEPAAPLDRRHSVCALTTHQGKTPPSSDHPVSWQTRRSLASKRNSSPAILDEHFLLGGLQPCSLSASPPGSPKAATPRSKRRELQAATRMQLGARPLQYASFSHLFPWSARRSSLGASLEELAGFRCLPRPSVATLSIGSLEEEEEQDSLPSSLGDAGSENRSLSAREGSCGLDTENRGGTSDRNADNNDDDKKPHPPPATGASCPLLVNPKSQTIEINGRPGGWLDAESSKNRTAVDPRLVSSGLTSGIGMTATDKVPKKAILLHTASLPCHVTKNGDRHSDGFCIAGSECAPSGEAASLLLLDETVKAGPAKRTVDASASDNLWKDVGDTSTFPRNVPKTNHVDVAPSSCKAHTAEVTYPNPCFQPPRDTYGSPLLSFVEPKRNGTDNPAFVDFDCMPGGLKKKEV